MVNSSGRMSFCRAFMGIGLLFTLLLSATAIFFHVRVLQEKNYRNAMIKQQQEIVQLSQDRQAGFDSAMLEKAQTLEDLQQKILSLEDEKRELEIRVEIQNEKEKEIKEEAEKQNTILLIQNMPAGSVLDDRSISIELVKAAFCSEEITRGDAVYQRINGKSYRDNSHFDLSDLRYLKVVHYNFDHELQVGELIVNRRIEQDILEIFTELLENEYEIQSLRLIDDYWAGDGDSSDYASIDKNNSSAFCYRSATGSSSLSRHAYGMAIDINPQQNPYVSYKSGKPKWSHSNADSYIDRNSGLEHIITHEDLCYKLFSEHNFEWGGDWDSIKDYQHFEK